ncbi:MAG: toll/interleukin-1 receptor domain-containing protein, partial [Flavisolibacter sp.]
MAYTSTCGYQHDVFISYAHADNFTLFGSVQWVSDFVKDLEVLLSKKLGTKEDQSPEIWIDHELAKNIPLDTALTEELKNAATYIVIMSPAYLESAWCKKERHQFLEILKQKGTSTRVFLVEIDQLERKKYPTEISGNLVPYKFWTMDDDDTPRTLGIPDRKSEEYYKCLLDVAKDMANELKKIKNISENKPALANG